MLCQGWTLVSHFNSFVLCLLNPFLDVLECGINSYSADFTSFPAVGFQQYVILPILKNQPVHF